MNSGGEYGDALDKCVNEPLLKSDGIKVITETPGGYAKMAAQAKSGVITNTVTDGADRRHVPPGGRRPARSRSTGRDSASSRCSTRRRTPNGFGASYYSTIMAWRADAKAAANWRGVFRHRKIPRQARPARLSEFVLALRRDGRRHVGGGRRQGRRPRPRLQDAGKDQEGHDLVAVRRAAGAACSRTTRCNTPSPGRDACSARRASPPRYNQGMLDISWWVVARVFRTNSATCCTNG